MEEPKQMVKDYASIGKIVELIHKNHYTDEKLLRLGYMPTDIEEARVRIIMTNGTIKKCPQCGIKAKYFVNKEKCFACSEIEKRRVAIRQEMRLKQQQQRNVAHA
jgi:anaerobic ribonucleoside-triphosphate reductase